MSAPAKTLSKAAEDLVIDYIAKNRTNTAKRDMVAILLSWRAGLRVAEIAALTWSDVCDATGSLSDQVRIRRETTKGKTYTRFVPMHPELGEALKQARPCSLSMKQPITLSLIRKAMTANALTVWFHRLYKDAGLDGCSSHSGRRTFITRTARQCANIGASIEDVRLMAGHASLSTTAAYIDANEIAKLRLVASL